MDVLTVSVKTAQTFEATTIREKGYLYHRSISNFAASQVLDFYKKLVDDKHSSLFCLSISDGEEKGYVILVPYQSVINFI